MVLDRLPAASRATCLRNTDLTGTQDLARKVAASLGRVCMCSLLAVLLKQQP